MARYGKSKFLPIVLIILVAAIAIALLVSIARNIFSGSGSTPQVDISREALLSTDSKRAVQVTVRGSIVADEEFYSYRITVTPSSRKLVTYNGYLGTAIDTVSLGNNIPAYEEFVHALDRAGMALGKQSADQDDVRGVCATGLVYEFHIINGDDTVKRLWTSTCSRIRGTLNADVRQLTDLFALQIPDGKSIIRKIDL
jgi:hypothetical protein